MRRKATGGRVLGPYQQPNGWRVVVIDRGGARAARVCETEAQAFALAAELRGQLEKASITMSEALDAYHDHQVVDRGNKPRSATTTSQRLRAMLPVDLEAWELTPARAQELYDDLRASGVEVDTHRNTLGQARTFGKWLVKRGYAAANPFAEIEGVGRRRQGKPQLRQDEARALLGVALAEADGGDRAALAVALALLTGLRAGEVCELQARDIDDNGRLLWVVDSKTAAGRRRLELPELLAERMREVRGAGRVFPGNRYWLHYHTVRLCDLAEVPRVTPHGLRGTHATLATDAGAVSHLVAASLGHASSAVTERHYTEAGAVERSRSKRAALRLVP